MLNLLLNKLGCSYLEHKKKHACWKLNYKNIKSITIKSHMALTALV